MANDIQNIVKEAADAFERCQTQNELLQEKANFLGKKGPISAIMATMRDLSIEEKKELGARVNVVKSEIENLFEANKNRIINAEIEEKIIEKLLM